MAQPITPALESLLVSKLQVGASKPRGEIEIDWFPSGFGGSFGINVEKTAGNPQLAFDALPENIIKVGSYYYTVYRGGWSAAHYSIGLARATAPEGPYTDLGAILPRIASGWEAGADQEVDSPFLVEDGGVFYLFYSVNGPDNGAGGISYATASAVTGPYTRHGSPVLSPGAGTAWDSRLIRGAALMQLPDTTWVMFYTGEISTAAYNTTDRIGYATAPAVTGPWTRYAGNPILLPGAAGSWDNALVRDPHVWLEDDGTFWMLYSGAGGAGGATPGGGFPWGIGIATAASPDGPWTKNSHNPFLPPGGSGAWDEGGPFRGGVWKESGVYTLMYAGFNLAASNARGGTASLEFIPEPTFATVTLKVASMSIDRSRKMAAAQLDVTLANELGDYGFYASEHPYAYPNNPIRAYAWLGDRDNRVQIFTGLIDRPHERRNPKTVSLKARSRTKWLVEQKFRKIGPQGAGEEGAIRTEDNGVYLGKTIEYIVGDILDRAGWPTADRSIATTGVTLAEYTLTDGGSWLEQIAGSDRLTTAGGCDVIDDELGVFRFEASPLVATSEPATEWDFAAGVNVMALDHEVDDEDRATRVEVTGPMTSTVPKWEQEWATSVIRHPVGLAFNPADADYLYAVDYSTQYLYKLRLSDRKVVAKWLLSASITYFPGGLCFDTVTGDFFVLDMDWVHGGTDHAKVVRFDGSTKAHVATYSLPDGHWSAIKTDGANLWLTNYGDDKIYKRTMTGGAVGAGTTITYNGVLQTNPTGLWIDGTTMGVFFAGHERFLLVDTSAPGTVTGTQSTKGTQITGGEKNTVLGDVLYADAYDSSAGHIWAFDLADEITTDVSALAIDYDLEDALGLQSGIAVRDHGDCPNDTDPHQFEARLATYSMKVVQSLAQAGDVADAQLALLSRLRRVMDLATLGHPGVQLNDPIRYTDAIAGIDSTWVVDSVRISVGKTYTQTMSVLPWEAP